MPGLLVDGLAICGAIVLGAWFRKLLSDMKKKFRKVYLWWKSGVIHEHLSNLYGRVLRHHQKQSELKRTFNVSGQMLKLQKARVTRNAEARFVCGE